MNESVLKNLLAQTGGLNKYFLQAILVIDRCIVFKARELYLISCKKLALGTLMVKNGSEKKIITKKFGIF